MNCPSRPGRRFFVFVRRTKHLRSGTPRLSNLPSDSTIRNIPRFVKPDRMCAIQTRRLGNEQDSDYWQSNHSFFASIPNFPVNNNAAVSLAIEYPLNSCKKAEQGPLADTEAASMNENEAQPKISNVAKLCPSIPIPACPVCGGRLIDISVASLAMLGVVTRICRNVPAQVARGLTVAEVHPRSLGDSNHFILCDGDSTRSKRPDDGLVCSARRNDFNKELPLH